MGTSRGYDAPTEGTWPALKREVTRLGAPGGSTPLALQHLLAHFAAAALGGTGGSGGTGGASSGTSFARTAKRVGARLGGFADLVGRSGLAEALRAFGLDDLVDRPANEVLDGLIDALVGPADTRDDALALQALEDLRRDLFADAATAMDVETLLQAELSRADVSGLVLEFYGYYLYEAFVSDFYERMLQRNGEAATIRTLESMLASVRRTVSEALQFHLAGQDPAHIAWNGPEGHQLCDQILGEMRTIFVVGEG